MKCFCQFQTASLILLLARSWKVSGLNVQQARQTQGNAILGRVPPPISSVVVATQTAVATGDFSTWYLSYPELTANSVTTQVIGGTSTVLPLWYCDPSLSAAACQGCPTTTVSIDPPCPTNYNMLLIVPPVVLVGVYIPPPPGLPTLKIGSDGVATPEPTQPPELTNTPSEPSSTSEEPITVDVPCTIPSIKAAERAVSIDPTPPEWIPPAGSPAPAPSEVLPVLPIGIDPDDPKFLKAWDYCGPGGNPYLPGGFYQFGSSFSRDDGLWAIDQFCGEARDKSIQVGEKTTDIPDAIEFFQKTYDTPGKSGKIIVTSNNDKDQKNPVGVECPAKHVYNFSRSFVRCKQLLGQTIDYCGESPKASSDIEGKNGGSLFANCIYFTIEKAPSGKD
ncbi:hypothetical protein ONS95_000271 [Cadophora gregata]|uniref:uncharacterized protein n=1 Tax=Cadophora gregata TaxID=51156 RepID=UPI0026DBEA49|nr:uncharacterized protein ONS95_000271 [Cadophora gregata]KAK0128296.1 hypothetical protein ONS95_000271 [Cadophora gregata]